MSSQIKQRNVTLTTLIDIKNRGEKFACLTAYDACFASILSEAGIEVILVGDSLGMVLQGHDSTLPVTMADMIYHMQCVKRGNRGSLLMADLPFMSYSSETQTLENAAALMRAGAHMVKLEGGAWIANTTHLLSERGMPVCAHMGLTPQSVNRIGGFHVQGRDTQQAQSIIEEASLLQDAGASILLLECVPRDLARTITDTLEIPVIGIGAGPDTTAQIMVLHDALGVSPITPKFVKNFLVDSQNGIPGAIENFVQAVKDKSFPADEHCFN
ncbi:MAG: 3-methyl-2-oxobutanoate hydroxymethyltransferase [Gammaproteobacteria bacterium]|jgi:3-methyl-2-oxobutanoate hydroxymethyltransferase|nr:3-methyl-2-oxobutanoate hydroxymethyltransferase [Gammaproteobacteria bacterium]MDP6097525.1 3-methyl-2-oxobutanoate hydroxymethyltransferase [Gammaproteobacteria bacterium]MDP7455378.1 3-methyl-2-oxobutanoate hydroxymethyltransferase [Gammaproteobacteria bacterium]HJO12770.1 3-methyl-2-oxobutanoate hydroxymethyltransferase [Gammaproteobacteria bacterium]|tara:strand:- start:1911 stop:2723 length:813 start_codon:yes stop_codon:yes gene_type:complete